MGDFVPGDDLTTVDSSQSSGSASIDKEIAAKEKEIAAVKDKLRIADQSLKNIDPKYQMNKAYIDKLNAQVEEYKASIKTLETQLADLKHQKELLSSPPPAKVKKKPATADDSIPTETVVKRNRFKTPRRTYNPLGKFSSYTYRLTMYMISPATFSSYLDTGVWDKSGMYVVAQSAGADGLRAPGFEYDYFIDNLEMLTSVTPKEAGTSAVMIEDFKFEIYEPYGMTFLKNLIDAAEKVGNKRVPNPTGTLGSAVSQTYLMVIRFYGYDDKGNLVSSPTAAPGTVNKTNDPGLFERTFPFTIQEISTKLDNKITKYVVTATPPNERIGMSQFHSAIQEPINLSGSTVSDILVDGTTSLIQILNKKEEELVKAKKKDVANKYNIVFEDSTGIGNAMLVDKNHYVPSQSPLNGLPGKVNVREANKGGAATVSKNKRAIQIPAGTRIMQAIEQVISQSTYITDCLSVVNKEVLEPVTDGEDVSVTNPKPKELVWFSIVPQIKYLPEFDTRLNSNAYEITYYVTSYEIPFLRSEYFPNRTGYSGPAKIFNYWYTGQNEGMTSFNMTINGLYQTVGSMYSTGEVKNNSSVPMVLTTSMGEDTAGKLPGTSEEVASLKAWLMSPDDQIKAHITIYGDPDFLMTASYGTFDEMTSSNIAEEAPVNPVKGVVYIEVDLRSVVDYDEAGKMTPLANYQFAKFNEELEQQLQGRMIYMVNAVKSKFSKGMFTQEFTDLGIPPTSWMKPDVKKDAQSREPASNASANKGKSLDPRVAAKARSDFAKIDPRRLDIPRPTKHDNGKPILAPVRTAEDEFANRNLVGKGYNSSAEVFNKDAGRRDSVSLLPKKQ